MNKDEFYHDLTAYYFTNVNFAAVRLKYIKIYLDRREVNYDSLLKKLISSCVYFPTLIDVKKAVGERVNELPKIMEVESGQEKED